MFSCEFHLRGSFQKLKCPFRKTSTVSLLCFKLVQLFGTKHQSSVLTVLIYSSMFYSLKILFLKLLVFLTISKCKDLFCHPANNKKVFYLCEYSLGYFINIYLLTNPVCEFYILCFSYPIIICFIYK